VSRKVKIQDTKAKSSRNPAWRFIEAGAILRGQSKGPSSDRDVNRMVGFLKALTHPSKDARSLYPDLADAFDIYNANQRLFGHRWIVEAYLMTSAGNDYIADLYDWYTGSKAVASYRKMFFDIDSYRHLKHCVAGAVFCLSAANKTSTEDCDYGWKSYAYEFGKNEFNTLLDFVIGCKPLSEKQRAYFSQMYNDRIVYASCQIASDVDNLHLEQAALITGLNSRINDHQEQIVSNEISDKLVTALLSTVHGIATSDSLEDSIQSNISKYEPRLKIDYEVLDPPSSGES